MGSRPEGWKEVSFGDVAELGSQKWTPGETSDEVYLGLEHFARDAGGLLGSGSSDGVESAKGKFVAGDALYGKLRPYFRKVAMPSFDGVCSTDIWVLRAKGDLDQRFLLYLVSCPEFSEFATRTSGGTRMPRANWKSVSDRTILLPPDEEQRRIAGVLGTIDRQIRTESQVSESLDLIISNLYDLICSNPEASEKTTLGEMCVFKYGKALPATKRQCGDVAVIGSSGVVGTHNVSLFKGPVIVVGRKGTAGSVIWVSGDAFPIDTTFVAEPKDGIGNLVLYETLKRADLPHLTADSAVPGLNRDAAYTRPVLRPRKEKMREFESAAQPLRVRKDLSVQLVSNLQKIRDELLTKLISGEVRVSDSYVPTLSRREV